MGNVFEWKPEYEVGIGSIDGQHRNLFVVARKLHTEVIAGQGRAAVGRTLEHLFRYTNVHFRHEERMLEQNHYPDFDAHKREHDLLTERVAQFQADYDAGRATVTIEFLQFLKRWLTHHISNRDRAYCPFVK